MFTYNELLIIKDQIKNLEGKENSNGVIQLSIDDYNFIKLVNEKLNKFYFKKELDDFFDSGKLVVSYIILATDRMIKNCSFRKGKIFEIEEENKNKVANIEWRLYNELFEKKEEDIKEEKPIIVSFKNEELFPTIESTVDDYLISKFEKVEEQNNLSNNIDKTKTKEPKKIKRSEKVKKENVKVDGIVLGNTSEPIKKRRGRPKKIKE